MTDDAAFVRAILAAPADDTLRLIYADFLQERDDPRADYLRLDVALAAGRSAEAAALAAELCAEAADIDPAWVAAVTRGPIRPCDDNTSCAKLRWEALDPTEESGFKRCQNCGLDVYFCWTLDAVETHAGRGDRLMCDHRLDRVLVDRAVVLLTPPRLALTPAVIPRAGPSAAQPASVPPATAYTVTWPTPADGRPPGMPGPPLPRLPRLGRLARGVRRWVSTPWRCPNPVCRAVAAWDADRCGKCGYTARRE